jgi:hypothetical protein
MKTNHLKTKIYGTVETSWKITSNGPEMDYVDRLAFKP